MIAELALANAAFAVIKEAVQNSGDLMAAGQSLFSYFDSKSAIQKKYDKKARNSKSTDLEEFMALEQLKKQEHELKEMMIYHGRGGLWDDWLKFQSEAKKRRVEAEKAEIRKSLARKAKIVAALMWGLIASIVSVIIVMVLWLIDEMRYR
jgi:hypothetical protein